jgi:3-mercaptopyruvate sulfurtransferase SseA
VRANIGIYCSVRNLTARKSEGGIFASSLCGGGSAAFVLTRLGVTNVAVYDGSLAERATDPTLPIAMD